MAARDIWDVVKKNLHIKTIGHRWVFDLKRSINSSVERFKVRLSARWVDCMKMNAPTASLMSLRLVLATAALKSWRVASFNISGAYLYSPFDENVLVEPPITFLPDLCGEVLHLKKALYDQSLYIFQNEKAVIAIWIHVNDGVVASNSPEAISNFKKALCAELNIKWLDVVQQVVGLKCAFGEGEVTIAQWCLTDSIIEAYPRQVLRHNFPLPVFPVGTQVPVAKPLNPTPFHYVIRSLAYLVGG
ncbi:hypothetical protein O181_009946 [Austropuccinia psidii MF-1]|uniref:Reverse transcriptase Ty1/copia-type domain-containing protein n=1 Tax=Austropuccinia psidii MF-1 TaxID=1389203 RepID=A0A9Q3GJY2_9BASI|nr:hypothetical protein [Austropuccinia psidii MF-1]